MWGYFSSERTWAGFGVNDAAVAGFDEWLRHARIMDCRAKPGNDVRRRHASVELVG
jgi:hypothetical protein